MRAMARHQSAPAVSPAGSTPLPRSAVPARRDSPGKIEPPPCAPRKQSPSRTGLTPRPKTNGSTSATNGHRRCTSQRLRGFPTADFSSRHRPQSPAADSSPSVRSKSDRENFRPASIPRISALTRSRRAACCGSICACKNSTSSRFSSADRLKASFLRSPSEVEKTAFGSRTESIRRSCRDSSRRRTAQMRSALLPASDKARPPRSPPQTPKPDPVRFPRPISPSDFTRALRPRL